MIFMLSNELDPVSRALFFTPDIDLISTRIDVAPKAPPKEFTGERRYVVLKMDDSLYIKINFIVKKILFVMTMGISSTLLGSSIKKWVVKEITTQQAINYFHKKPYYDDDIRYYFHPDSLQSLGLDKTKGFTEESLLQEKVRIEEIIKQDKEEELRISRLATKVNERYKKTRCPKKWILFSHIEDCS
jgi:hypothetical protein